MTEQSPPAPAAPAPARVADPSPTYVVTQPGHGFPVGERLSPQQVAVVQKAGNLNRFAVRVKG